MNVNRASYRCTTKQERPPRPYIDVLISHVHLQLPRGYWSFFWITQARKKVENVANGFILNEADGKRAFDALKPVCVRVMSSPSLESLAELRGKVSGLPVAVHPHLVDYVLLPVRVLFKRCGR